MSKGSPIVQIRIPPGLLKVVDETIERANKHRFDGDWTRSSFINSAIREKLDKMERSRKKKKPIPQPVDLVEPGEQLS